jgi:hypothetical protein
MNKETEKGTVDVPFLLSSKQIINQSGSHFVIFQKMATFAAAKN